MHDENPNDIKIPIKDIVSQAMTTNGARYEEDEFNLLRRYFIACLNLGYLEPKDLVSMVNKFASKVKIIVLNYNNFNNMDCFMINNGVLYINGGFKEVNSNYYEINFFKAVTHTLFETGNKHIGILNAITEIAAEKLHTMDMTGSRIVMPKTEEEMIGENKIQIRSGYMNYNLIVSLAKQLLIARKLNENVLIRNMYFEGFDKVINNVLSDSTDLLLLEVLDKICIMYSNRKVKNQVNTNEKSLIDKYQVIVNDLFTNIDQNYFAFCALITTDDLRKKCMSRFSIE